MNLIASILFILLFFFLFITPLLITLVNVVNLFLRNNKLYHYMTVITLGLGIPLTLVLRSMMTLEPYWEALYMGMTDSVYHTPIAGDYAWTPVFIIIWFLISWASLYRAGKRCEKHPPMLAACFIAGIYAGWILCVVYFIQIAKGIDFMWFYMCVLPFNILMLSIYSMLVYIEFYSKSQESYEYKNLLLNKVNRFMMNGHHLPGVSLLILVLIFLAAILLLELFGQKPDVLIRAFTETSEWTLSQHISPPPIVYDSHYLCTVSLRGHKKLVKPIRYGIRGGEKIIVNRQLCIANAFEQLIEERAPGFHKAVRGFYDKYGYPVSRHIKTPLAADITYLIMKPLEWLFLAALYLFDKKPEDRIALQYLGVSKRQVMKF